LKRTLNISLLLILVLVSNLVYAQSRDSLNQVLKNAKHDTIRSEILSNFALNLPERERLSYYEDIIDLCEKNLKPPSKNEAELSYFTEGLANAYNHAGDICKKLGNIPKALEYYTRALEIREKRGDKEDIANSLNNIGVVYFQQANIPKALEYLMRSLKIQEEIGDKPGVAATVSNIGSIYEGQGETSKALEFYKRCLSLSEEIDDKGGIALALNNIGSLYVAKKDYENGILYYEKGFKIAEEIGHKHGMATFLNGMAIVYRTQRQLEKSHEYLNRSLKIREEIGDKQGVIYCLLHIADVFIVQKKYPQAIEFLEKDLALAKELGFPGNIKSAAFLLSDMYKVTGKYKLALENYELYVKMQDSITNVKTKKAAIKNQLKYEYEKQAAKDSIRNAEKIVRENIKHEEAIKQQRLYTYGGAAGFGLMLVIAGISFRAYRQKRNANAIISQQKKLVEKQKLLVEEKQRDILDSIHYAKRIQTALITNDKYIEKTLKHLKK
jgi:tetratricopeptide (TPR) repeat protein